MNQSGALRLEWRHDLESAARPLPLRRYSPPASEAGRDELAWILVAQRQVGEALEPMRGLLDGVYAHINNAAELHLYVLDKVEEYNHELAMALGKLEVNLTQALQQNFDDVQVHSVPFAGLEEVEVRSLHNGVNLL